LTETPFKQIHKNRRSKRKKERENPSDKIKFRNKKTIDGNSNIEFFVSDFKRRKTFAEKSFLLSPK
jgi:hypothetical protein